MSEARHPGVSQAPCLAIDRSDDGVLFHIHVTPRARRPRIGGLHGDALRVSVAEPALEGRANAACSLALAKALGLRPADVRIDPASKTRRKRVRASGQHEGLIARLRELATGE